MNNIPLSRSLSLYNIYIYIYIYVGVYIYIYIYTHIVFRQPLIDGEIGRCPEALLSIKRAGATVILTYYAKQAANTIYDL